MISSVVALAALLGPMSAGQVVFNEETASPAPWLDVEVSTLNYGPGILNEWATQGQKNFVKRELDQILNFRKELEADGNMLPTVQWSFNGSFHTKLKTKNVISWEFGGMNYTGGAHPNHMLVGHVLVLQNSQVSKTTYSSLFKKDSWPKVEVLVRSGVMRAKAQRLGKDASTTEKIRYEDLNSFSTSQSGLVFLFPHYVVGAYAEGSYSITVPWTQLKNHLTPQGLIVLQAATSR